MSERDQIFTALVDVTMPDFSSSAEKDAWELDTLRAINVAVRANETLDICDVSEMTAGDCEWIYEFGMPIPKHNVTIYRDGSWSGSLDPFYEVNVEYGHDLHTLFHYLASKKLARSQDLNPATKPPHQIGQ